MRNFINVSVLWCTLLCAPAYAQGNYAPALTVNQSVITHYDIDQRIALLSALGAGGDLRQMSIEQLTEDRIKVQAAREIGISLPEGALDAGLQEFAEVRGLTMDNVLQVLSTRGIDRRTMDDFVEAGLLWREVIAARFRARALPTETDLDAALEIAGNAPREILQIGEIALPFAEHGEAATLALAERLTRELSAGGSFAAAAQRYSRSGSAENGGLLPPMPASGLPPALRGQVLLLEPGQVTRPIPITGGVVLLKLVAVRAETVAQAATEEPTEEARQALREELFSQRISSFGQGYLQELIGDALIIVR